MAVTPAAVLQTIHSHMIRKPANLTLVRSITNHQLNDILGQSSYAIYYCTGKLFSLSSIYLNIYDITISDFSYFERSVGHFSASKTTEFYFCNVL